MGRRLNHNRQNTRMEASSNWFPEANLVIPTDQVHTVSSVGITMAIAQTRGKLAPGDLWIGGDVFSRAILRDSRIKEGTNPN